MFFVMIRHRSYSLQHALKVFLACTVSLQPEQKHMHNIFILLPFPLPTGMDKCMVCMLCGLQVWNYVCSILHFDRNERS